MFHDQRFSSSPVADHQGACTTPGATRPAIRPTPGAEPVALPGNAAPSSPGTRRRASRRKSLGQGMTEYIVIVALVGVAAIGVYSFLGQSIRGATSGIALEIAGESADKGIKAAKDAADKAVSASESKATLKNYNANNH